MDFRAILKVNSAQLCSVWKHYLLQIQHYSIVQIQIFQVIEILLTIVPRIYILKSAWKY